jgi:hypothetical protein
MAIGFSRGRRIAATWLAIAAIAHRMLNIFAKSTPASKSWASHRMIKIVLLDVTCGVSDK